MCFQSPQAAHTRGKHGKTKKLTAPQKGDAKGDRSLFLFRSPVGNHFVTFFDGFGLFFTYPLMSPPFCARLSFCRGPMADFSEIGVGLDVGTRSHNPGQSGQSADAKNHS